MNTFAQEETEVVPVHTPKGGSVLTAALVCFGLIGAFTAQVVVDRILVKEPPRLGIPKGEVPKRIYTSPVTNK